MATLSFDTHATFESLIKSGIKKEQAEAIVRGIQQSRDIDMGNLVTKDFLAAQINAFKAEIFKWFITTTFIIIGIMISGFAMIIQLLK